MTGKLGEVMRESTRLPLVTSGQDLSNFILTKIFTRNMISIFMCLKGQHSKDGPSAGITMATALVSALSGRAVRRDVAMTGEITLRGNVLPIGGLKEKSLSAHRAGITTIIIPFQNERDVEDIPKSVRDDLTFIQVKHLDEVLKHALVGE